MEFNKGEFWIQAHDLPFGLLNSKYATSTANLLGKLVDLDCLGDGPQTAHDFLRFRVELDLTKPRTPRFFISRPDGSESWVMLKYERLSDFFYRCRESCTNKVIEKFAGKWTSEMRTTSVRRLQAPNHRPSSSPKPHQVPITTNMAQHTLPTPIPATTSPTTPEQYPHIDNGFEPPLQVAIASVTPTYRNSTSAPAPECSNYYVTEPKEPVLLSEQTNLSRPSVSTGVFINTSLAVALSRLAMKCKHDDYSLPGKRMKPLRLGSLDTEHESGNSDTGKEDTQLSDHSSSQILNYTHGTVALQAEPEPEADILNFLNLIDVPIVVMDISSYEGFSKGVVADPEQPQGKCLKNAQEVWVYDSLEIKSLVRDHFESIFKTSGSHDFQEVIDVLNPVVSDEMNDILQAPVTNEEIYRATKKLGALKAPGEDGFLIMLPSVNKTLVVLIPKSPDPETLNQFRPISLCNFVYKIISKILSNRLKPFMNKIISPQQSAFILGRQIQDCMVVANEAFHYIRNKRQGTQNLMALKVDLNKAFDRVEWDFLLATLRKLGFGEVWCNWIQTCLMSYDLEFMVNDVLSRQITKAMEFRSLLGIKMARTCPVISHIFFADDSIFFLKASQA
ncbi:reverse transcriptase [Tanacetum coccineum]